MKVEVEQQPDSVSTVHVELPPEQVTREWNAIADDFARHARVPGFRKGKVPRSVAEKRFQKEIQAELTKKLVSKGYRDAISEKQLRVVSLTNIETEFGEDKSMKFKATVVTAPEFELPEYKNIPVELPSAEVKTAEVDEAIERLREQAADFIDVTDRALQMEDFAVIDFEGTLDAKPIAEAAPESSKNLQGGKKFWLRLAPDNFLPNFCEQIVGLQKDETRSVAIDFPAEFPVAELAAKRADYAVTLSEIKQRVLPEIDDSFAEKMIPGKKLEDLRHAIEHDLEHGKEHEIERAKESQIVKHLQENVKMTLPPPLLRNETRRALSELVQRNRERGVPDDMLKSKEKELIEGAGQLAAHRLTTNFILQRIAEQEKIQVTRDDIEDRMRTDAMRYNVTVEKLQKELDEHDGISALADEILLAKTLDFLKSNVSVQTTLESAGSAEVSGEKA